MSSLTIGVLLLLAAAGVFWLLRRYVSGETAAFLAIGLVTALFGSGAVFVVAGLAGLAL
jgi:hypothetical protein